MVAKIIFKSVGSFFKNRCPNPFQLFHKAIVDLARLQTAYFFQKFIGFVVELTPDSRALRSAALHPLEKAKSKKDLGLMERSMMILFIEVTLDFRKESIFNRIFILTCLVICNDATATSLLLSRAAGIAGFPLSIKFFTQLSDYSFPMKAWPISFHLRG